MPHRATVQNALVLGPESPSAAPGERRIVVDARLAQRPGGTLDLAHRTLDAALAPEPTIVDLAAERVRGSLLRRFVGDERGGSSAHRVAVLLGRLQHRGDGPTALVLAHLDDADAESLRELPALLWDPSRNGARLILHLREEPLSGPQSTLWRAALAVGARFESASSPGAPRAAGGPPWPPPGLHPSVISAVRALAELGEDTSVDALARALDRPVAPVLELLQAALDAGVPVQVGEEDRLSMPSELAEMLRRTTLPTLRALWQARADEGGPEATDPDGTDDGMPAVDDPPTESVRRPPDGGAAFGQRLREAVTAAEGGAFEDAVHAAQEALSHLPPRPSSDEDRLRRGGVHLALASWMQGGPAAGGVGSLDEALRHAKDAIEDLTGGPVGQRAAARAVAAAISYEKGDLAALEWGIQQLTQAVSELHAADRPIDAARLLNDQAALLLRAGDPLRANGLLRRSREIFERMGDRDPVARREIAECDHLLARLPFHVGSRPGHEREAWERALQHAREAHARFESLHLAAEVARVTETAGRILLRLDRDHEAEERLLTASKAQEHLHDALGLARTTSALSEFYARAGRFEEAVTLLAESARLNRARGSVRGLEVNRDAARLLLAAAGRDRAAWMAASLDTMGLLDDATGPTTQE